jgi:ankyrin repeat protein
VEYVRLLLGAGADPGTRTRGITPLENAIYSDATQVVDLLAGHGIVPQGLWTYAACGLLDLVRACFDADGRLRPDAASSRPNPADRLVGFPPRIPATDDPEAIIAEAFVHACQHGRTEVVRWFLDLGVSPDVAPYFGRTGLHWAIPYARLEVIRLLLERGTDPSVRDEGPPSRRRRLAAPVLRHSLARSRDPATPRTDRVPDAQSYRCGCRTAHHAYRPALPANMTRPVPD